MALRCSDQLYACEWKANLENLFLSPGEKSQLELSLPLLDLKTLVEGSGIQGSDSEGQGSIDDDNHEEAYYSEKATALGLVTKIEHGRRGEVRILETVSDVRRLPRVCVDSSHSRSIKTHPKSNHKLTNGSSSMEGWPSCMLCTFQPSWPNKCSLEFEKPRTD